MKFSDINIRDPYIMKTKGKYYLYGTRSTTTWGMADGFDCYESDDMKLWNGPFEIFHKSEDFEYDRNYWAPECYEINGGYYLITTLASENKKQGVYALYSDSPKGPFIMHSEGALTPGDWSCIDGTLHFEDNGDIYLVFSHGIPEVLTGDMAAVKLSKDLKRAENVPFTLFKAEDAPWAVPIPFAKEAFGLDGKVYFSDGPCSYKTEEGRLLIIWSSWSDKGYEVGTAVSDNGSITGNWTHIAEKLYPGNGGHGMILKTYENKMGYLMHYPNDKFKERPVFHEIEEDDNKLKLI